MEHCNWRKKLVGLSVNKIIEEVEEESSHGYYERETKKWIGHMLEGKRTRGGLADGG